MHVSTLPRVALHVAAVGVLAAGSVVLSSAPGRAAAAARPDSYGGQSTASALHVQFDRTPGFSAVSDPFHVEAPYAISELDSSGAATASAAPFFPGQGLLGVPGLICQAGVPCASFPPVPSYPAMASASYPTSPDAKAQTSSGTVINNPPLTVTPLLADAHADPNRVESQTQVGGFGVAGVVTAASASTHSKQVFEGSTLVVTADCTVTGIDLGGGQLHIDAVRSVSVAHVDGGKVTSSSAVTTVIGATAGGHPVAIDSTGIHVDGQGDNGAVAGGVNKALANLDAQGIKVRLTNPTHAAKEGAAEAATGGLLVTVTHTVDRPPLPPLPPVPQPPIPLPVPLPGVPAPAGDYLGTLTLAGAGVTAFATPALPDLPWIVGPPPVPPAPQVPPAGTSVPPANLTNPGSTTTDALGHTVPPALAGGLPGTRRAAVLGIDLTDQRLRALALVLLGYPALVLLTSPLRHRPRRTRV